MDSPLPTCWPDRLQELLIRATILNGGSARAAWDQWVSEADFDHLDRGSQRLLPEAYTKLSSAGIEHELLGRMKGVKRRTWLENQILFHQATAAIRILQARGMETMVTKGPALVLRHYLDLGRRPMADFDIVVKPDRAREAVELLHENGYRLKDPERGGGDLTLLNAVSYINESGRQFDLHWHILAGCTDDRPFWEDASPVSIMETTMLAPSPTDLLFHVCVHGLRLNRVPPLRWVVDASVVIGDSNIDWDRLLHLSKRYRLQYHMREALRYLERFDVEIPNVVLQRFASKVGPGLEKLEFELNTGSRRKSIATQVAVLWLGFKRYMGPDAGRFRIGQFAKYLKRVWQTETIWSTPLLAIQKGLRRMFLNPSD